MYLILTLPIYHFSALILCIYMPVLRNIYMSENISTETLLIKEESLKWLCMVVEDVFGNKI